MCTNKGKIEMFKQQYIKIKDFFAVGLTLIFVIVAFILLHRQCPLSIPILVLLSGIPVALFCNYKQRCIYLILLGVFTCFEWHFILHYGVSFSEIGTQALITLHITEPEEIKAYLKMFKLIEYIILLLFALVCVCEIVMKSDPVKNLFPFLKKQYVRNIIFCLGMVLFTVAVCLEICPPVVEHIANWGSQKNFYNKRESFKFNVKNESKVPLTVVLVIGESHRKDIFDRFVFGQKSYAPFLKKLKEEGNIWEFNDVITHYQQTYFSVFTLLSRRGDDGHNLFWPEKGLFGLFQEAGFKTTYITYQKKHPEIIGYNFVVNEAENYINHKDFSGTKFDHGMLNPLALAMADKMPNSTSAGKSGNKFIAVKMVGVHFHYQTRYPRKYRLFTPCYSARKNKSDYRLQDKELLVNSYYNAMAFNVTFLDEVAKQIHDNPAPTVMVFISDHGVINYDDNKNAFFGAAKSNFHIPCFIYGNAAYRKQLSQQKKQSLLKNRNLKITNSYMFDTIASLANLTYPGKREYMDLTSDSAKAASKRDVWVVKTHVPYEQLP